MPGERRLRILTELVGSGAFGVETKRLCEVSAEVIGVSGAGIMLMSGDVPRATVCSSNEVSALIEQLQYTLGEGPCVDAHDLDRPVLEPNLAHPVNPRWIAFAIPAIAAGVRAVFGFPLQVGAVRLGALNLYRDQPGPLSDDQHADALVLADVSAAAVLMMQAKAPPGRLAPELETGADLRYVVHQASGMVAAQLEVSIAHAMVRLRGYAFVNDRHLNEVAQEVVGRQLRFESELEGQDSEA
jgi:GAF domain-containing protein